MRLEKDARNAGMKFATGVTQDFTIDAGAIVDFNYETFIKQGFEGDGSLFVMKDASITTMNNSGTIGTYSYILGTISTLNQKAGSINHLRVENGGRIGTLNITAGSIPTITINSGGSMGSLAQGGGSTKLDIIEGGVLNSLNHTGGTLNSVNIAGSLGALSNGANQTINAISLNNGFLGKLQNNGNITSLTLNGGTLGLNNGRHFSSGTIGTLNIQKYNIVISSDATQWNSHTSADSTANAGSIGKADEHIYNGGTINNINPSAKSIKITAGEGIELKGTYSIKNIIAGNQAKNGSINASHIEFDQNLKVQINGDTFSIVGIDVANSYGASILRAMSLSYMRRISMSEHILDSVLQRNIASKAGAAQPQKGQSTKKQSAKLKKKRLANKKHYKSSIQPKSTDNFNVGSLQASRAQSSTQFGSAYTPPRYNTGSRPKPPTENTNSLSNQTSANSAKNAKSNRFQLFILPYGVHSYVQSFASKANEFAGGSMFGAQANLPRGISLGGYIGYEYTYVSSTLASAKATIDTHSLQGGLSFFMPLSSALNREWYIKGGIRGSVDFPNFRADFGQNLLRASPKMNSVGAEIKGGVSFFPLASLAGLYGEVGLSYDMLMLDAFYIDKKVISANAANEDYPRHLWHFPQISASLKWQKIWGKRFKSSFALGGKYNILHTPSARFSMAGINSEDKITLPAVYGNADINLIWNLQKSNEIALNYTGIYFAAMDKRAMSGISTTFAIKYAKKF